MTGDWPFAFEDAVRYGDLDANGHMNNVVFLQFFEDARIAFVRSLTPGHDAVRPSAGTGMIFAEAHINYRSPAFFGEQIRTHIRPSHLRRSSFRCTFAMECVADGRLLAEGWGAMVGYDYAAGRPQLLPAALRQRLIAAGAQPDPQEAVADAR